MNHDRTEAATMLWNVANQADGMISLEQSQREHIVNTLRYLADSIERAPQNMVGVVLYAGEKTYGEDPGITLFNVVSGSCASIAASYLAFEEAGLKALNETTTALLKFENLISNI